VELLDNFITYDLLNGALETNNKSP
jgi:hypothetical protein